MRLLISIAGLLLLANVLLYLWPRSVVDQPVADNVYPIREDINPDILQLMKELEEDASGQVSIAVPETSETNVEATIQPQLSAAIEPIKPDTTPVQSKPIVETLACYRVGPFLNKVNRDTLLNKLKNDDIDAAGVSRQSKKSKMTRIFWGPYSDRQQVLNAKSTLKGKAVDHFVRVEDDGLYTISLGVYASQQTADKAYALFNSRLGGVKIREETLTLPERHWLYLKLIGSQIDNKQWRQDDWGERSAKVKKIDCLNS